MKYFLVIFGIILFILGVGSYFGSSNGSSGVEIYIFQQTAMWIRSVGLCLAGVICVCSGIIVSHFEEIELLLSNKDDSDQDFIFYCRNCNEVYSGSSQLDPSDMVCPKCGEQTIVTEFTKDEWKSFSAGKKKNFKKRWSE